MGISKGYVPEPHSHPPARSLPGPQANILVDDENCACLADFGLLTIATDQSVVMSSRIGGGTYQWMSPELLNPEDFDLETIRPTKNSDCYALGMVIYEVLSGQIPFASSWTPAAISKVLNGERPRRPQGKEGELFTDGIWGLLDDCWKHNPKNRPHVKAVLQHLEGTPPLPQPSSSVSEVSDTDTDEDFYVSRDCSMFSLFRRSSQAHLQLLWRDSLADVWPLEILLSEQL